MQLSLAAKANPIRAPIGALGHRADEAGCAIVMAKVVNGQGRGESANAARLEVDELAALQLHCHLGLSKAGDAFVEADGGAERFLGHGMADQIVGVERLLDHGQREIFESVEHFHLSQAEPALAVNLQASARGIPCG